LVRITSSITARTRTGDRPPANSLAAAASIMLWRSAAPARLPSRSARVGWVDTSRSSAC
jgi:hypothetical protein